MRDLDFISGRFQDLVLPKEKKYLLKYCRTRLQKAILKYYLVFDDTRCFVEHTGFYTTKSYLLRQRQRIDELEAAHRAAKIAMDMEQLLKIETGRFKFNAHQGRSSDDTL